ncbi:MAG: hypothetical protein AAGA83_26925 [Cyanobacteria bacterium P01_F01_bin.116]
MIFTIINYSSEIDATAAYTRPPAALKTIWQKFWQFSNSYGDYHSLPPSRRRQFVIEKEQQEQSATAESCL